MHRLHQVPWDSIRAFAPGLFKMDARTGSEFLRLSLASLDPSKLSRHAVPPRCPGLQFDQDGCSFCFLRGYPSCPSTKPLRGPVLRRLPDARHRSNNPPVGDRTAGNRYAFFIWRTRHERRLPGSRVALRHQNSDVFALHRRAYRDMPQDSPAACELLRPAYPGAHEESFLDLRRAQRVLPSYAI